MMRAGDIMKNKNHEIELLESLMLMKCYDDGSYEKAIAFAKKATHSGRILIKAVPRIPPVRLCKTVGGFNSPPVFYQRYEIIGHATVGALLDRNIIIYELRSYK